MKKKEKIICILLIISLNLLNVQSVYSKENIKEQEEIVEINEKQKIEETGEENIYYILLGIIAVGLLIGKYFLDEKYNVEDE